MGSVVSLATFKKKVASKIKRAVPTEDDEFKLLFEGLVSQWNYEESKNNTNNFVAGALQIEHQDFINDLNIVSNLECESNLTVCITSPTFTEQNSEGWVASFIIGDKVYSGIQMDSEIKSRLFCVLMYHVLMQAASKCCTHK